LRLPFTTPYEKPTRAEALTYYRKAVDTYQLQVALYEEVQSVERSGETFIVESRSSRGVNRVRESRTVVLAMGYYGLPNLLGVPGEDLPHVSHFYREAHPHYRQRVVIVGGKNSACEAALELHRAGAHVTMIHRGPALGDSVKYWVKPDIENRIKEGAIAARFSTRVIEIRSTEVVVGDGNGVTSTIPADAVLLLTGYRADPQFLRRAGIEVNEETQEPRYDPQTFETNVPGLFVAGGQQAGNRTGSVFIENGRFHGERIAEVLAARLRP
jgi:thioredoxin reductase (NADPH)